MYKIQQKYDLRQFPGFILLIIVALLFTNCLSAQNPAENPSRQIGLPHIQNFTPEDYGAGQQNHYITQDPQGLIYVANDQGVLQYDGSTWRLIPITNGSTAYSLVSGADGVTYVGGEGEIGYLAPDENGDLQYVSMLEKIPARYRDFNYGWQIVATSQHVFFATDKYFFRWQTDGTDKQMEAWVAKNIYHNCFALDDEIYVWEWEAGLEQLVDNSL